ncbi:MAG: hypothetical protein ACTS85_03445 [Arsenophonus sp. NC-PG7-MAG3]
MIKTVNSDTELLFAKAAIFQLETEHAQLISLTNNNSYVACDLVLENTYILYL